MGTYNLTEGNLSIFLSDTISLFCKNILTFQEECCIQGKLSLIIDKDLSFDLSLGKTATNDAFGESSNELSQNNTNPPQKDLNSPLLRECDHEKLSDRKKLDVCAGINPVRRIQSFLSKILTSFCCNMMNVRHQCHIQGKLYVRVDKENEMVVDIHENIEAKKCRMSSTSAVLSDNNSRQKTVTASVDSLPKDVSSQFVTPQTLEGNADRTALSASSSPSKRKRKQANPTSLSRLESSSKIIVIEPQSCNQLVSHNDSLNETQILDRNNLKIENGGTENMDNIPIDLTSQFSGDSTLNQLPCRVLPMVHLLKKESLTDPFVDVPNGLAGSVPDLNRIPPLIRSQGTMGPLDALVEDAILRSIKDENVTESHEMYNPIASSIVQNSVAGIAQIVDEKNVAGDDSSTRPKPRCVNSLLEVPDNEVQQMLNALMASGQTKDTCDEQQCNICCPTLAYIRFRDRNRKNKSRFSMETIEQVVNVQMYGGGTKYRDVQRMFTTHLRKLRAQHICEKRCMCCEKLLLRESKKPNSNYLPHNVVPYKNAPAVKNGNVQ